MSLQENVKKKSLSPPPESLRGGHFGCPPLNCSGGGQFSGRGGSPPPEIAQGGGQSPIPPPVSALVYNVYYTCLIS